MRSTPSTQPVGIVILVTLGAIFGIFGFFGGLSVFGFGAFVTSSASFLGTFFSLIGFLIVVVGVLEIVVAFGAWLLRSWAWRLGVLVGVASVAVNVLWVAAGGLLGFALMGTLGAIAMLYCLDSPTVRAALRHSSPSLLTALTRRPVAGQARSRGQMVRRPIRPSDDN